MKHSRKIAATILASPYLPVFVDSAQATGNLPSQYLFSVIGLPNWLLDAAASAVIIGILLAAWGGYKRLSAPETTSTAIQLGLAGFFNWSHLDYLSVATVGILTSVVLAIPLAEPSQANMVENLSAINPTVVRGWAADAVGGGESTDQMVAPDASASTTIDVLLVYETKATNWVKNNGGMAAFSADVINRMNQATLNSNVNLNFRLVHAMSVAYTTTSSPSSPLSNDLSALTTGNGVFADVHAARNTYGADVVAMLSDTGSAYGYVGQGWMMGSWAGSPNYAFTVNAIQSVAISHTLTHEVGHNLGAHHSKKQSQQPGPNTSLTNPSAGYSAGWYFTGSNGKKYHTIMAYNSDGNYCCYEPAPLFSTPLISYQGTAAGHPVDGDNARLLREAMGVVAAYRATNTSSSARLINLSTRGQVGTGDNALIGGFVIGGTTPKKVLIRALGPALGDAGVTGALANPSIRLTQGNGTPVATNDNWKTTGNASEIQALGLAPKYDAEAALLVTLQPNVPYTPIVEGVGGALGVALIEVYEVDGSTSGPRLINLSTRGRIGTGDNVLIGGFVIGGTTPKKVLIRALGPALGDAGVTGALANPSIRLTQGNGTPVATNDNWKTTGNASEIQALGLAPKYDAEAALLVILQPNVPYTPIVEGIGGTTGVGLVEIYEVE